MQTFINAVCAQYTPFNKRKVHIPRNMQLHFAYYFHEHPFRKTFCLFLHWCRDHIIGWHQQKIVRLLFLMHTEDVSCSYQAKSCLMNRGVFKPRAYLTVTRTIKKSAICFWNSLLYISDHNDERFDYSILKFLVSTKLFEGSTHGIQLIFSIAQIQPCRWRYTRFVTFWKFVKWRSVLAENGLIFVLTLRCETVFWDLRLS